MGGLGGAGGTEPWRMGKIYTDRGAAFQAGEWSWQRCGGGNEHGMVWGLFEWTWRVNLGVLGKTGLEE